MTAAADPRQAGQLGEGAVDAYEPWTPQVRQMVRFLQGECPLTSDWMRSGMVGTVYHVEEPLSENGVEPWHRFWVDWGEGKTTYCAAIELEPLTPPPAPDTSAEVQGDG